MTFGLFTSNNRIIFAYGEYEWTAQNYVKLDDLLE